MGLFLIPSHKQSFPTQRRSPMKLRMARQHTGRGTLRKPKGRGREAGRDQSCSQAQGLAGRRGFPSPGAADVLQPQSTNPLCSQAANRAADTREPPLESGSADTLQPAQPGSISHCWAPPTAWDSQQQWPLTHSVNMNVIPRNQINNASTFHFLPLAEDHLTRTDEQIHCKEVKPVINPSRPPGWHWS